MLQKTDTWILGQYLLVEQQNIDSATGFPSADVNHGHAWMMLRCHIHSPCSNKLLISGTHVATYGRSNYKNVENHVYIHYLNLVKYYEPKPYFYLLGTQFIR